jgi:hypothetical protein
MLALIAAIVLAAVLATSGSGGVQLRRVDANDAQQAVQQLQDLVDGNTK